MAGLLYRNRDRWGDTATDGDTTKPRESRGEISCYPPVSCLALSLTASSRGGSQWDKEFGKYSFEMSAPKIQDTEGHAWI